jgi:hypothetical protein
MVAFLAIYALAVCTVLTVATARVLLSPKSKANKELAGILLLLIGVALLLGWVAAIIRVLQFFRAS